MRILSLSLSLSLLTIRHDTELRAVSTVLDRLRCRLHSGQPKQWVAVASECHWVRLHAVLFDKASLPRIFDRLSLQPGRAGQSQ